MKNFESQSGDQNEEESVDIDMSDLEDESVDVDMNDDSKEFISTEGKTTSQLEAEGKTDPSMKGVETATRGEFGQPLVHDEKTMEVELGENQLAAYAEKLAHDITSEGPMGRLLQNYPDLMRKLKNRLSSEYQSMAYAAKNNLDNAQATSEELHQALLEKGEEITAEIFNAHKDEIEQGEDKRFRGAA